MNQLSAALRELRTASGLSLAGLAAKTPYSKSSWERYLNGKTLPPREAVEELSPAGGRTGGPVCGVVGDRGGGGQRAGGDG